MAKEKVAEETKVVAEETKVVAEETKAVAEETKAAPKVVINLALNEKTENGVLVGLNGKMYLVMPGVDVEVPKGVAAILKRKEKAMRKAWENRKGKKNLPK